MMIGRLLFGALFTDPSSPFSPPSNQTTPLREVDECVLASMLLSSLTASPPKPLNNAFLQWLVKSSSVIIPDETGAGEDGAQRAAFAAVNAFSPDADEQLLAYVAMVQPGGMFLSFSLFTSLPISTYKRAISFLLEDSAHGYIFGMC